MNDWVYVCITDNGRCNHPGYEPGSASEAEAWTKLGWCEGTSAPTNSHIHVTASIGGCPEV